MNWVVRFRPEVEQDMAEAAAWYEARQAGLGGEFVEEVIRVWYSLAKNPLLNSRRHPKRTSAGGTRNGSLIASSTRRWKLSMLLS